MSDRYRATMIVRRGQPIVRIEGLGGPRRFIEAWKENGEIHYSRPERVPRDLKNRIVPKLFLEFEKKAMGQ